jgi:hypothetical protein
MEATNPSSPSAMPAAMAGSKDGLSAADHDVPYAFGRRPRALAPYPFNERQYMRLLILRSRLDAALPVEDCAA